MKWDANDEVLSNYGHLSSKLKATFEVERARGPNYSCLHERSLPILPQESIEWNGCLPQACRQLRNNFRKLEPRDQAGSEGWPFA